MSEKIVIYIPYDKKHRKEEIGSACIELRTHCIDKPGRCLQGQMGGAVWSR